MGFFKGLFGKKRSPMMDNVQAMNQAYDRIVSYLAVEIFGRAIAFARERFPDEQESGVDTIAAHIKIFATGEQPTEKSLAQSTAEQRERARQLAADIMNGPGSGLYINQEMDSYPARVKALPPNAESLKRLAIAYDHAAVLLCLGASVTFEGNSPVPIIDRAFLAERALPLLQNALAYDAGSSLLQATAAQFFYTMDQKDVGFEHAQLAVSLDPQNAEAWRLVGNALMISGQDAEARAAYERALRIQPSIDGVREAMALLKG